MQQNVLAFYLSSSSRNFPHIDILLVVMKQLEELLYYNTYLVTYFTFTTYVYVVSIYIMQGCT